MTRFHLLIWTDNGFDVSARIDYTLATQFRKVRHWRLLRSPPLPCFGNTSRAAQRSLEILRGLRTFHRQDRRIELRTLP